MALNETDPRYIPGASEVDDDLTDDEWDFYYGEDCCIDVIESPTGEHNGMCENYDGAPVHQYEVTEPAAVYDTDDIDEAIDALLFPNPWRL